MEKTLVIPIPPENVLYPSNISRGHTTIITAWKSNELCGYVFWESDNDEWHLYIGTEFEDGSDELQNIMERHPDITFKVNC